MLEKEAAAKLMPGQKMEEIKTTIPRDCMEQMAQFFVDKKLFLKCVEDQVHQTALMTAAYCGKPAVCDMLLPFEAKMQTTQKSTALMIGA